MSNLRIGVDEWPVRCQSWMLLELSRLNKNFVIFVPWMISSWRLYLISFQVKLCYIEAFCPVDSSTSWGWPLLCKILTMPDSDRRTDTRIGDAAQTETLKELERDPDVLSVTRKGMPPGWFKVLRRRGSEPGKVRVVFRSLTKRCLAWVPTTVFFKILDSTFFFF